MGNIIINDNLMQDTVSIDNIDEIAMNVIKTLNGLTIYEIDWVFKHCREIIEEKMIIKL